MIIVVMLYAAIVLVFVICLMIAGSPRLPDEGRRPPIDAEPQDDEYDDILGPYGLDRSAPEHAPDRAPTRGGESDGSGAGRSIHSPDRPVTVPRSIEASDAEILCGYLLASLTRDGMAMRERERTA